MPLKFKEAGARFSPDGRWLAYYSNETGRDEGYVRTYPSLEGKTQVSTGGGHEPVWSKKGDELFEDRYYTKGASHTGYDVSRDGRFLMVKAANAGQPDSPANRLPQTNFIVVLNWFEELTQKLQAR